MATEVATTPSSRKRKRSLGVEDGNDLTKQFTSRENFRDYLFSEFKNASSNVDDEPKLSQQSSINEEPIDNDREGQRSSRRASGSSVRSDDRIDADGAGIVASVDGSRLPTAAASPVTSESSIVRDTPVKATTETDVPIERDDDALPNIVSVVAEADDAEEIEVDVRSDDEDEVRPLGRRRWAGRRRAAHPNPNIESAMRRQLELKSAYRAIARACKPALAELAQRTVDALHVDPELHKNATEHAVVQSQLQAQLDQRKARLNKRRELNALQLQNTLEGEQFAIRSRARHDIEDARDHALDQLEAEMLRIARLAHVEEAEDGHETEDEDGIIPSLRRVAYRFDRQGPLKPIYDSRSRVGLETRRATDDLQYRLKMGDLLKTTGMDRATDFTVMDSAVRDAAIAKRHSIGGTKTLAEAAREVERTAKRRPTSRPQPSHKILPNRDAAELMMLAEIASFDGTGDDPRARPPPSTPARQIGGKGDARVHKHDLPQYHSAPARTRTHRPKRHHSQVDTTPDIPPNSDRPGSQRMSGHHLTSASILEPQTHRVADALTYGDDIRPSTAIEMRSGDIATFAEPSVKVEENMRRIADEGSAREQRSRPPASSLDVSHSSLRSSELPANVQTIDRSFKGIKSRKRQESRRHGGRLGRWGVPSKADGFSQPRKDDKKTSKDLDERSQEVRKPQRSERARSQSLPEREARVLDRAAFDGESLSEAHLPRARAGHERPPPLGALGREPTAPPPPPFGPPLYHGAAPPEFDVARFRPMAEHNFRTYPEHPPFTPTAQPVNHFGQNGIHRSSFTGVPPLGAPSSTPWSAAPPSPLVGLPHAAPSLPPHMPRPPFYPPSNRYSHFPPMPPPPFSQPPQSHQYGGQVLAPAGGQYGYHNPPPPAFAQQMDRQDQHNRRRHTEGSFHPFRTYNGPKGV